MDNTKKFDSKADAYTKGRPSYAAEFIDMLYCEQGFSESSVIADIGSGTGILSSQLLERGSAVYAVEPNTDMRTAAERALSSYSKFKSVNGTAENTGLDDSSVDFITVAQAFHWFDVPSFKAECKRILKPHGKVFLVWNSRDVTADVNVRQSEIFKKYCPNYKGFNGGVAQIDSRISEFFDGAFKYREFDNPLCYGKQKFIQRSLSGSYALSERDENYDEFIKALGDFFDCYAVDGVLTVPNKTEAYFNVL